MLASELTTPIAQAKQSPMSNTDSAIRDLVESFVEQLRGLIQQAALESVQAALNGGAVPGRRGLTARRGLLAGVPEGAKRTAEELEKLVLRLHAHVTKNPGQRIEQIGKTLGISTKELRLPAKKLLGEKKLSTKGAKRATTYFAR